MKPPEARASIFTSSDGSSTVGTIESDPDAVKRVVPESMMSAELRFICAWKPK
jgi:hypothetical protein